MTDSTVSVWYGRRPDLTAVRFTGADVLSFLQSKLAADTRKWRRDGGGYAVATDINGKVLFDGEFALHRVSGEGDQVIGVIPTAVVAEAVAHLERYVIMEDVTIATLEGASVGCADGPDCLAVFGFESAALRDLEGVAATTVNVTEQDAESGAEVLAFRSQGSVAGAGMWLFVFPETLGDSLGQRCSEAGELREPSAIEAWEIATGVPRLGRDFRVDETIAIEAGLWNGMSLSKGCYLGQEVLERLFSRGNPARRLVRFTAAAAVEAGDKLTLDGSAAGWVTSSVAAPSGSGVVGMAMLRRKAFAEGASVETESGVALQVGEFVGGPTPESP